MLHIKHSNDSHLGHWIICDSSVCEWMATKAYSSLFYTCVIAHHWHHCFCFCQWNLCTSQHESHQKRFVTIVNVCVLKCVWMPLVSKQSIYTPPSLQYKFNGKSHMEFNGLHSMCSDPIAHIKEKLTQLILISNEMDPYLSATLPHRRTPSLPPVLPYP